ncbi:MAG: S-adenosylmethionine:tRNA ribosyltransferase-isomerase [Planctomycetes bacterium]|nr:S-adenosylmethionine:tRNA ribosyltransferase-isomerase [Planctomycetota bacterium]
MFDFDLPEHLIAQHPAAKRDESRLLVFRRDTGTLEHRTFRDLPDLLNPGDLLVLNDTKVLPARVVGRRESTGGKWEGLFLRLIGGLWEMLAQTRSYPEVGSVFVTDTGLRLTLRGRTEERHWLMEPGTAGTPAVLLAQYGHIPLPPYIRKGTASDEDEERYQTVYAAHVGSVAAPTAGLHFTPELFERLAARGIETARVTLHVGLGTFLPVKVEDPTKHVIHREWCEVTQSTVDAIHAAKARHGRVIAVGTTTTRTLESAARAGLDLPSPLAGEGGQRFADRVRGEAQEMAKRLPLTRLEDSPPSPARGEGKNALRPFCGETDLYILPPFEFRVVDAMVTNFHLPRTTLLLLVSALAGSELLRTAYADAVAREYRFYSYGDAMLVL